MQARSPRVATGQVPWIDESATAAYIESAD